MQKYFRENLEAGPDPLTNTEWNSDRILSLPLFPDMNPEDVERVVKTIKSILSGKKS